jgi:Cu+-exporting ATPase
LSRGVYEQIEAEENLDPLNFSEIIGKGIEAIVDGHAIRLGSSDFVATTNSDPNQTQIHVKIDETVKGRFVVNNNYRKGLTGMMSELGEKFNITVLTGDNEGERENLNRILPEGAQVFFRQKPEDKLKQVRKMQDSGQVVMMLGDGLNDAGALAQSDAGIAVSENINVFSPACDGILDASSFDKMPSFLRLSKNTMQIIKMSFVISFLYNIIGLLFAITGNLSPVVAAILMPVSSISVVIFATLATNFVAKKVLY